MEKVSLFGAGFIGGKYAETYPDEVDIVPRNKILATNNNILYLISTIHNYLPKEGRVYEDIETNLVCFVRILDNNANENTVFNLVSTWFVYGETPQAPKERGC